MRDLPQGVYRCSGPRPAKKKPYRAMVFKFPDMIDLGTYATPEEAHHAWKNWYSRTRLMTLPSRPALQSKGNASSDAIGRDGTR